MEADAQRPFVTTEEVALLVQAWLVEQRLSSTAAAFRVEAAGLVRGVEGVPRSLTALLSEYVVLKAQGRRGRARARTARTAPRALTAPAGTVSRLARQPPNGRRS